jgi:hypothetical protein
MDAYLCLSTFAELRETQSGYEEAIRHTETVRDYYVEVRDNAGITAMEYKLKRLRSELSGERNDAVNEDLDAEAIANLTAEYQRCVSESGEDSPISLIVGSTLGHYLLENEKIIEAQRLLTVLAGKSRRVHGPTHHSTVEIKSFLKRAKERRVGISSGHGEYDFQVISFDEGGNRYIVKGPILTPRIEEEEKTFPVAANKILFGMGMPVVCVGLKNAVHRNGELGFIRGFRGQSFPATSFEVHFDKEGLTPTIVKLANLRIAFDV